MAASEGSTYYTIRVHHEDRTWWAEVDEISGYSIAGPDVRSLLTDLADALVDGAGADAEDGGGQ